MSAFRDPFDASAPLGSGCSCGHHASQHEHEQQLADTETLAARVVETAVVKAVFGTEATRRGVLQAVGAGTALAAISQFFPLGLAKEVAAQTPGPLEKKDLKIGFIPITCATPIIMAHPMGFYAKHGLERRGGQDRRLGGDPRQDAQQGIRRGAHALADAARDHAGRRLERRCRTRCRRSRTSTARRSRWR